MYATDYFETKFLNVLRGTPFSAPSALYIGLYLSSPCESGTGGIEASYTGYERVAITFDAPTDMNNGKGTKNSTVLTFALAPSDSGTVTHIGISDAKTGGNMLLYGKLTDSLTIKANEAPTIQKGEIIYYLNGNLSSTYKKNLINVLRGTSIPSARPYIALFSGSPEVASNEFNADNYEREEATFSAPAGNVSGRMLIQTTNNIAFNVPSSDWGNLTNFAIMDDNTGGCPIYIGTISPSKEVKKGFNVQILAGNLKASID